MTATARREKLLQALLDLLDALEDLGCTLDAGDLELARADHRRLELAAIALAVALTTLRT
jgi:hypothetical protein